MLKRQSLVPMVVREESPGFMGKVLVNGQSRRLEGKCHRKYTAFNEVRVKWCGKSAPLLWRHGRQGKPHLKQDLAEAAMFHAMVSGWSLEWFGNETSR